MKDAYTVLVHGREVVMGTPELCDFVRAARNERGISLRELARRSGVSAGQLSRIESGEAHRPAVETLQAIADAFGRQVAPLLFVAGHIDRAELDRRVEALRDTLDDVAHAADSVDAAGDEDVAEVLWRLSDAELAAARFGGELSADARRDVSEIATAWSSLTPERRQLVLAFVADQEVLSNLDRMPAPPGRYELEVTLNKRGGDHA